jgi:hypothetical protein
MRQKMASAQIFKGTVSRGSYFFESLYALMVFTVFQKLYTTLYNYKLFICFCEITY